MYPTDNTCHENAVGHVINGVFECFCKPGFYENGKNCTGNFNCLRFNYLFIVRKDELNLKI